MSSITSTQFTAPTTTSAAFSVPTIMWTGPSSAGPLAEVINGSASLISVASDFLVNSVTADITSVISSLSAAGSLPTDSPAGLPGIRNGTLAGRNGTLDGPLSGIDGIGNDTIPSNSSSTSRYTSATSTKASSALATFGETAQLQASFFSLVMVAFAASVF